jgi:adenine-specific DNA-methyltransferase
MPPCGASDRNRLEHGGQRGEPSTVSTLPCPTGDAGLSVTLSTRAPLGQTLLVDPGTDRRGEARRCKITTICSWTEGQSMKDRTEVSSEKLRGGFYSPPALVATCLDRIDELLVGRERWRILEPSAGDGAFVRGLAARADRLRSITAVELVASEAAKVRDVLDAARLPGTVITSSFVPWAATQNEEFDAAVGNPPFVRFQFVDEDPAQIALLGERLGVSFRGVSNLWLPIFLGAVSAVAEGGAFAFIVPSECFTGISARAAREWLLGNFERLSVDLFPVGSFPAVLQEVVVLSGRRTREGGARTVLTVREHRDQQTAREWQHLVDGGAKTWTRYLLEPNQVQAFEQAAALKSVHPLGRVARIEVATVTGANGFFSVDDGTLREFGLEQWAEPLLPRIRHAPSLEYTHADHLRAQTKGAKTWLLDFSGERPNPEASPGARRYLESGRAAGLHKRFKTRIREPWYRVPGIKPGRLLLSKRSHRYPRLVLNTAGVATTDTIYRGWMRQGFIGQERALVAAFHNSLTLLSAEVEGRSFGGGVLELVPSEVARLLVPLPARFEENFASLARFIAADDGDAPDALVAATNRLLYSTEVGFDPDLVAVWEAARQALQKRRLARAGDLDVEPGTTEGAGVELIAV